MSSKIIKRTTSAFEWRVENYFQLSRVDNCVFSPYFRHSDVEWRFMMFPNGRRRVAGYSEGWMSLNIQIKMNDSSEYYWQFMAGIKSINGIIYRQFIFSAPLKNMQMYGNPKLVERSVLSRDKNILSSDESLTVFCVFPQDDKCNAETSCQTEPLECLSSYPTKTLKENVCQNFKDLLLNKVNCDVTFEVKDQKFVAHRIILQARSPVFAAMFQHNMEEKRSGVVNIADTDPDVFQSFLMCVYSGEVDNVSSKNVCSFYKLADKYELIELKEWCVDFIKCNMSFENVCDVYLLASLHNERKLESIAKVFIAENIAKVIKSDSWSAFVSENQSLSIKILEEAALTNALRKK